MTIFIALAKGELGKDIEKYLQSYGLMVQLDGRPLQFVQRIGNRVFRPMQSKDVPWYVATRADYGITGEDLTTEYNLGNGKNLKILERLGFGKADLAIFAKGKAPEVKRKLKRTPVVAVPYYYRNMLTSGQAGRYIRDAFGDFEPLEVSGSTEGFVAEDFVEGGAADLGFDLTTMFYRPAERRGQSTIPSNGLTVLERIMPTEAVVVARDSSEFTMRAFEDVLNGPSELDWKKMNGLLPAVVQDASTGKVLMVAYVNQNALQETQDKRLATFWSRSRNELWTKGLTSGNTMQVEEVRYDCDGDALLYIVKPNGPACHIGERSCFYRQLQELK